MCCCWQNLLFFFNFPSAFSTNWKNLKQRWEVRGELLAAKVEQGGIRLAQYPTEYSYTFALTHIFIYIFVDIYLYIFLDTYIYTFSWTGNREEPLSWKTISPGALKPTRSPHWLMYQLVFWWLVWWSRSKEPATAESNAKWAEKEGFKLVMETFSKIDPERVRASTSSPRLTCDYFKHCKVPR